GFCIFANVAIAATHARQVRGLPRVAVVDWDVHHGNGTEHAFYDDPSVLTISIHQDNNYPPNSGAMTDTGSGAGTGYNINVPLPAGSGVGAYVATFERRSEEHTSELQSHLNLVCRLLLEKKKNNIYITNV